MLLLFSFTVDNLSLMIFFVTEHLDPINVKIAELREALESVTAEQKYLKARDARHRNSKLLLSCLSVELIIRDYYLLVLVCEPPADIIYAESSLCFWLLGWFCHLRVASLYVFILVRFSFFYLFLRQCDCLQS